MICPNCRAEYRPGFTLCPDCGIELVDHLPSEGGDVPHVPDPDPTSDFVEVYRASGRARGEMIRSLLEGNGIPCALLGAWSSVYNLTVGDMAEVRVMVRAEDLEAAGAVLDAADRGELELDE